ncbi:serine/threonine protein kinase, partial [Bacillus thuringiensis]|nr:serine/threonine protein kinase [Bacillus thuringiensis]
MKDNSVEIQLNNVTFQLKEYHNFDWLIKLGTVFAVFDQQDSGNI